MEESVLFILKLGQIKTLVVKPGDVLSFEFRVIERKLLIEFFS